MAGVGTTNQRQNFIDPQAKLEGEDAPLPIDRGKNKVKRIDSDNANQWLLLARHSYNSSTSYLQANVTNQWLFDQANHQNRHPNGSVYHTDAYKARSRLFRPKTRTMVRQKEAAAAKAFFSTSDVVNIEPKNDNDPQLKQAAQVMNELVNIRLNEPGRMNWFLNVIGGIQDAAVNGVVVAHTRWMYKEQEKTYLQYVSDDEGNVSEEREKVTEVTADHPKVDLVAPENLRISPASDWTDPIRSSPYIIEMVPMFVTDVLDRMREDDNKTGQQKWHPLNLSQILTGIQSDEHSVRQSRHGDRIDPTNDTFGEHPEFKTVWIHRNIIRRDGRDWFYYTLGVHHMLTEPEPLEDVYLHCDDGSRPYVLGQMTIETHKVYPTSVAGISRDLQAESNHIANQRVDNVRLAMNQRFLVRNDDSVDFAALRRSSPGGYIRVQDVENSVKPLETKDVTSAAYEEQDRLSVEFDALTGQMDQSSVQSNRALNETVGGMNLLASAANVVQELDLRVFVETFMEPLLRQIVKLEQAYEDDVDMLALAGAKAGVDSFELLSQIFNGDLAVSVNVGMGATDPVKRVEKLILGLNSIASLMPHVLQQLNTEEVITEIFGALGYKNGARFFMSPDQMPIQPPDPAQQHAEQQMQLDAAKAEQEMSIEQQKAEQEMAMQQQKLAMDQQAQQVNMNNQAQQFSLDQQLQMIRAQQDQALAFEQAGATA